MVESRAILKQLVGRHVTFRALDFNDVIASTVVGKRHWSRLLDRIAISVPIYSLLEIGNEQDKDWGQSCDISASVIVVASERSLAWWVREAGLVE